MIRAQQRNDQTNFWRSPHHGLVTLARVALPGVMLVVLLGYSQPAAADLVAHYMLDGTGADASGNGHNGTVHGGPTAGPDRFSTPNSALYFDGVDDYVDIEQLLFNGNDMTIAFWAKAIGEQNTYGVMVSQGHWGADSPYDTGLAFQLGYPYSNNSVFIWGNNAGGEHSWQYLFFDVNLRSDESWHHYAATKEGDTVRIYLDGSIKNTSTTGLVFSSYGFNIGRDTYNEDHNHRSFNGAIDDLYVYNRALSEAEILALSTAVTDSDGDGVVDTADNCPDDPNPDQSNIDDDSLGDVCDPDDDNDGVADLDDNCPINANPLQEDFDLDGFGNACDASFDGGPIVAEVESLVLSMVDGIVAADLPGGNGMIAKLTGNGGVLAKIGNAVDAFENGLIDIETYIAELQDALDKLTAFDNQLAVKFDNGQVPEPDASEMADESATIRAIIGELLSAVSG